MEAPFEKMIGVLTLRSEGMAQLEEMEYEERCPVCSMTEMVEMSGASVVMVKEEISVMSLVIS